MSEALKTKRAVLGLDESDYGKDSVNRWWLPGDCERLVSVWLNASRIETAADGARSALATQPSYRQRGLLLMLDCSVRSTTRVEVEYLSRLGGCEQELVPPRGEESGYVKALAAAMVEIQRGRDALALLKRLEHHADEWGDRCLICEGKFDHGEPERGVQHEPDCELARLIGAA